MTKAKKLTKLQKAGIFLIIAGLITVAMLFINPMQKKAEAWSAGINILGNNEIENRYENSTHQRIAGEAYVYVQQLFPNIFDPKPGNLNLSNTDWANLVWYADAPDIDEKDNWSNWHFYNYINKGNYFNDGGLTAKDKFISHYEEAIYNYNDYLSSGDKYKFLQSLGRALHYITDIATPVHTGDQAVPHLDLSMVNNHIYYEEIAQMCVEVYGVSVNGLANIVYDTPLYQFSLEDIVEKVAETSYADYYTDYENTFWDPVLFSPALISMIIGDLEQAAMAAANVLYKFAVDVTGNAFIYTTDNLPDGTLEITGLIHDYSGALIIPWEFNGKRITSIRDFAFRACTGLTSVVIPDSVTSIGQYAFTGCNSLQSMTIPFTGDKLNNPFRKHFGSIFGAPDWSYQDYYIPSSLKTVIITGSTRIPENAFYRCKYLTDIMIPESVVSIGHTAFYGCSALTSMMIPDSVTSIETGAFWYTTGLQEITVSSGNTAYTAQDGVLYNKNMTELIEYPAQKASTVFTVPSSVTTTAEAAFALNPYLQKAIIGVNCQQIGASAFYGCSNLKEVFLLRTSGIIACGSRAFFNYYDEYADEYSIADDLIIYVAQPLINSYKTHSGWANCADKIQSHATAVTFNSLGGSACPNITIHYGETLYLLIPIRAGYTFSGWCDSFNGTTASGNLISGVYYGMEDQITLYAKWDKVNYSITYAGAVTSHSNPAAYTVETPTVTLTAPAGRNGYTFGGWYDNSGFTGLQVTSILLGSYGNKTLYAKWDKVNYSITYVGAVTSHSNPAAYTVETPTVTLTAPAARNGYTFGGWYDNPGFTGSQVTSIPLGSYGNKTLYAKWDKVNYSITYVGAVTLHSNPAIYTIETPTVTLTAPAARNGYTFGGWYDNSGFTGLQVTSIPLGSYGNKILYAKWTPVLPQITQGLQFTLINGGTKYEVSRGSAIDANVIIPAVYNGLPVTAIADYGFQSYTAMTSIAMPDSIVSIGNHAFSGCRLTTVTIPGGVLSIGESAFASCENLTTVIIAANSGLISIGDFAFDNCSSLQYIVMSDNDLSIGDYSFLSCFNLMSITMPECVIYIGNYAFYYSGASGMVIYAEAQSQPDGWDYWNPFCIPVIWGCGLSVDKSYVVSIETCDIPYGYAFNAPYRDGYIFGGWSLTGGMAADYDMTNFQNANSILYAIWIEN